ncbi:anaphase-promoting complex subunit cdc27, partial [Pichia californica]
HDMLDTAEFTAERLLAQENRSAYSLHSNINNVNNNTNLKSDNINSDHIPLNTNISLKLNNNSIGTPTPHSIHNSNLRIDPDIIGKDVDFEGTKHIPNRQSSLDNMSMNISNSKLDAIHLYSCVLFQRKRFKAAYNVTSEYCTLHVGCSYIFAKCCKELECENEGIRALLRTMNQWEGKIDGISNSGNLIPDSIACYMLLAKLYSAVGDVPRASMHYSQILKLNPFIFEAFEELCRMGVQVKIDSIYKNTSFQNNSNTTGAGIDEPILETKMEQDIELNEDEDDKRGKVYEDFGDKSKDRKGSIFKTPKTKSKSTTIPTSSPESSSSFITPIGKGFIKSTIYNNKSLPNKPISKSSNSNNMNTLPRGSSITSRLLLNPQSGSINTNISSNLEEDITFFKKESTTGTKRDMLSAFGGSNNDVFASNNKNTGNFKYVRNNGLTSVFNGIGNSSMLFDEHEVMKNLNNEYLLSVYSKLAKGYLAFTTYDCFKAIRIFDSLPENERNSPWVLSKLGRLHFEIVNYEEAEIYFEKLRKIDRTRLDDMEYYSTLLWHLHKEVELSFLAHELHEVDPKSAISWISIGNLFSFRKAPEDAVRCFGKAIECNPKCAYAYTLQGHEYLATDAFENALNSFRHAIVLDKRHYNAFYGIGMVYLKLGDLRKAEFHFRKAVEINPVNVILLCCVGVVLEKLGRKEESLQLYELSTKLQPLSMLALFKKAQVLFSLKQYDEAVKDFEKLENLAPDEASVHFLLGKLYKYYGRKHEAIKQFTIALNLDPKGSHLIKEAMENLNDGMVE